MVPNNNKHKTLLARPSRSPINGLDGSGFSIGLFNPNWQEIWNCISEYHTRVNWLSGFWNKVETEDQKELHSAIIDNLQNIWRHFKDDQKTKNVG